MVWHMAQTSSYSTFPSGSSSPMVEWNEPSRGVSSSTEEAAEPSIASGDPNVVLKKPGAEVADIATDTTPAKVRDERRAERTTEPPGGGEGKTRSPKGTGGGYL